MKLLAFKVEHFRCLYDSGWIPFAGLSTFTGENDGGKTATLRALEIFFDPKAIPTLDDYSHQATGPINQEGNIYETQIAMYAKLELRDSEKALLNSEWGLDSQFIEIKRVFVNDSPSSPYLMLAEAHNDQAFRQPLNDYTVPQLKEIATNFSINLKAAKLKQEIVDAIRDWLKTQPKSLAEVRLPDSLVDTLPEIQIFSSESALDPEQEIRRTLTTQFRALIETDKYSGTITQIKKDIETDLNSGLERLSPFIKEYSTEVESVKIRPSFNFASGLTTTELQLVRKDGRPILLQQSGAGQRRRCSLAVYEWSQEIFKNRSENSRQLIMAFDEPDTHLDYKSQRQIFDLIKRFADLPAIQVVVCTHSLNFLERVPIDQIVHYRLEETRRHSKLEVLSTTDHETTELFLYEISKNMGLRNSVMLHERCFLIVEGATEVHAVPILFFKKFKMPLQSAGICLINGDGNYGVRMLAKFLHSNRRQVIFLVDTEVKIAIGSQKHFTPTSFKSDNIDESSQVFYVGNQEFEDAFTDELWAKLAQTHYPKKSGIPWAPADFAALRTGTKFSKGIQILLQKECGLGYEPPKSELGYRLAQVTSESDIPSIVINCLEQAYKLANL